MKCEKCARELPGSRVTCPDCGFNNTAQRVDRWKAQRQAPEPPAPPAAETAAKPAALAAARVRARYEAKLLQFPVPAKAEAKPETEPAKETAPASEPAWRELARAKVREHQQRRQPEAAAAEDATTPPIPEDPTSQLIVESALKRIRRTQAPPVVRTLPRALRHTGGQAVARALDYEEPLAETPSAPDPPVPATPVAEAPAPAPRPALRSVPRRPASQPVEPPPPQRPEPAALSLAPAPVLPAPLAEPMPDADEPAAAPAVEVFDPQPEPPANAARKNNVWVGKPAPIWLRALAGAVDLEAAALAYLPFFGAYTSLDGPPEWGDLYLMASILAVVVYLYQLITYSFNGRTVGMALCGLRCVDVTDANTPISFKRRLWQALGGTIGLLCPPFNFVVTRVTEYQRGLADALGQTITLRRAQD